MSRLRTLYLIVANTAILLIVVEVGTHLALTTYDHLVVPMLRPSLSASVQQNYAHMTAADRDELLDALDRHRWRYEPVVGLVEAPATSKFLNVDEHGIRQNRLPRRPIAEIQDAIWFFGGSTTFGEGVADRETIPAQLEELMARPVVNFGVRNYASGEENLLFGHYLRIGYRPGLAIFLDGINEGCKLDSYDDEMATLADMAQRGSTMEFGRPVTRLYARLRNKVRRELGWEDKNESQTLECMDNGRRNPLSTLVTRRLAERAALCALYEVECRTFVQPFSTVHGPREGFAPAFLNGFEAEELRALYQHLEPVWQAANATFITGVLDNYPGHPFVDDVHYSASACRLLAGAIATRVAGAPAGPGQ